MSIVAEVGDAMLTFPIGKPSAPSLVWPFGYGIAFLALLWCCMTWNGVAYTVGGILCILGAIMFAAVYATWMGRCGDAAFIRRTDNRHCGQGNAGDDGE